MDARAERIALFLAVRNVPYATDGAHDAETLMISGCGDCLAKSAYLIEGFRALGYQARKVRWLYHLPNRPAEVRMLPSREDVHSAAEALIDGRWTLVDATHDPPLAAAGLAVAVWDGITDTVPAYEPRGPLWRPGDGPAPVPNADLDETVDADGGGRCQKAFNRWLREVRAGAATNAPWHGAG
ncbi:transglutaminase domain-containing protein [Nonomuraea jabiensis]|uniref:Transglutaminase-like putative cysteine protease n=1 Tax=Nonomuraea jabiensis TaxID=882448 RepID=A0A7W9LFB5_9ACTN|nr:transglutaminase domain-containing protein [Nonomuraea jabiensis]MBB5781737.1 transglutaminase-like putative cysteine protease [Nonomuraea jabiensis]